MDATRSQHGLVRRTMPIGLVRSRWGRWLVPAVTAVLAVAASWLVPGTAQPASLEEYARAVADRVPERLERDGVPGAAVAVVVDGELVWADGFGVADRDTGAPVTGDTVFQAGSISKSLMAWAVVALAEEGAVALDAPVEEQLEGWQFGDSPHRSRQVTPRRLLAHTAGLPFAIEGVPTSSAQLRDGQVDRELFALEREPGEGFVYSNPGFALLALLVEEAGDASLAEVMDEVVLGPIGMDDSTFTLDASLAERAATGYTADGEPVPVDWAAPVGASGLHTTSVDLARFVEATVDADTGGGDVMGAEVLAELHRPHVDTAGVPHALMADASALGHFVETLPNGERAVAHGGEEEGWVGGYVAVPATGDGLVVLTNSRRGYPLLIDEAAAWADWRELDSLRLTRARDGLATALRAVVGLLIGTGIVLLAGLLADLATGRRRLAPLSRARRVARLARLAAAGVLAVAWWGVLAPPLATFVPRLTHWTSAAVTLCAAALVASAAATPTRGTPTGSRTRRR